MLHFYIHALIVHKHKTEISSRAALPFISTLDEISVLCYLFDLYFEITVA